MVKASGVFLQAWSDDVSVRNTVLRSTKGGNAHITAFYSGALVDWKGVSEAAKSSLNFMPRVLRLVDAHVNTFTLQDGTVRHDVLMTFDEEGKEWVEIVRANISAHLDQAALSMGPPHITHAIHYDLDAARLSCNAVKQNLGPDGVEVTIVGVTLD